MSRSPVTVGIAEGQDPAVIRFAAAEAGRLDRPLRIVHVVERPAETNVLLEDLGADAGDLLATVEVERVTLFGDAGVTLLAESDTACRMVLGADDEALTPARWSEVAQMVSLHATVPVVVVPMGAVARSSTADVLVAIDDVGLASGQLAYAMEAAEQRGSDLSIVFGAGATSDYPGRLQHLSRFEDLADQWRERHPSVPIHVAVEGGHPVDSCLAAGRHASLLVVGRPASRHPRIGSRSVASRILREAEVPVAVVPLDYAARATPALRTG